MGNSKTKFKESLPDDVIFKEVYSHGHNAEMNVNQIQEYDNYFSVSDGVLAAQTYIDEIKNELKINIDSPDKQFFDLIKQSNDKLLELVTDLCLRSNLKVKDAVPIQDILELMKSFSEKDALTKLEIRFEFVQLDYNEFQQVTEYIKACTKLTDLNLRLNKSMLQNDINANFLNSYAATLYKKDNLKRLNILFSLRNTIISKDSFQIYLEAFSKLSTLEDMLICIENTTYSDVALDIINSVVHHKNLEIIFLDILQYNQTKQPSPDPLKLESLKEYSSSSKIKHLTITKLRCDKANDIFSLVYNLPVIQSFSVTFMQPIGRSSEKQITLNSFEKFSSEKKYLLNLHIELEESLGRHTEYYHEILSNFNKFYAYSFSCICSNYVLYNNFYGLHQLDIQEQMLSVIWNDVKIGNDSSHLPMIAKYINQKNAILSSIAVFKKIIQNYMLCNPQFILVDLYIQ